ncbi:uncharacterized protein LOC119098399 [Pollicipes pollicipes]|uniref:uncharacterized protein LOC119098399 n=1 Tax=Pollicipes pollicipes TaxID=41117 RepID=UPI00188536AB|nr:uncharacterized protein LOC119098399 [Pollicipes pollicipes]
MALNHGDTITYMDGSKTSDGVGCAFDILIRLTALDRVGKKVTLCWIPSHVGIVGNKLADAAAKRASHAPCESLVPDYCFLHW